MGCERAILERKAGKTGAFCTKLVKYTPSGNLDKERERKTNKKLHFST